MVRKAAIVISGALLAVLLGSTAANAAHGWDAKGWDAKGWDSQTK